MRTASSADYFIRTPANSVTTRAKLEVKRTEPESLWECSIDVRVNQENFTRGLAIHVPSDDPLAVANVLAWLMPQLKTIADSLPGNVILGISPDVRIGAGLNLRNHGQLELEVIAPWLPAPINVKEFALSKFVFVYCDAAENSSVLADMREVVRDAEQLELVFLGTKFISEMMANQKPSFFISYDARTKESIARPIATRLNAKGERVWFDEFSLRPGDNIREAIENGLRQCEQCVLLVTKEFIQNEAWAKVEFDAIFSREVAEKRKLIIPVWVDVTRDEVSKFSLSLPNKYAVVCTAAELQTEEGLERVSHAITQGKTS